MQILRGDSALHQNRDDSFQHFEKNAKPLDKGTLDAEGQVALEKLEAGLSLFKDARPTGLDQTPRNHIGLNTWESLGGPTPPAGTTGLYHLAILYPTRAALADVLQRVLDAGIPLDGASDHGASEALYLRDPDDNGVELYWDRPQESWPRAPDGRLAMFTRRLDLEVLLREAQNDSQASPGQGNLG